MQLHLLAQPAAGAGKSQCSRQGRRPISSGVVAAALMSGLSMPAFGQVPAVLSGGPPVQVIPYVAEPGVPAFSVTPGTANPFAGADGSGSDGSGGSTTGSGGSGGNVGSSDALSTMLGTSWGANAVSNAQSLGVNPSALAAMCVLESGCQATTNSGSAQGTFQIQGPTFQSALATALAANPALASQVVQGPGGVNDPTTAAIAASGYLMQASQTLQNAGIADPTVAQARAFYNFGPTYGTQVAQADSGALMSNILPSSWLQQNGIITTETVGQWNAANAAKAGSALNQSILS